MLLSIYSSGFTKEIEKLYRYRYTNIDIVHYPILFYPVVHSDLVQDSQKANEESYSMEFQWIQR